MPHDHEYIDRLHEEYLDTRRRYRVALRVHLEEIHGVEVGRYDPERLHRDQSHEENQHGEPESQPEF